MVWWRIVSKGRIDVIGTAMETSYRTRQFDLRRVEETRLERVLVDGLLIKSTTEPAAARVPLADQHPFIDFLFHSYLPPVRS
jgi:hypothetical protein